MVSEQCPSHTSFSSSATDDRNAVKEYDGLGEDSIYNVTRRLALVTCIGCWGPLFFKGDGATINSVRKVVTELLWLLWLLLLGFGGPTTASLRKRLRALWLKGKKSHSAGGY